MRLKEFIMQPRGVVQKRGINIIEFGLPTPPFGILPTLPAPTCCVVHWKPPLFLMAPLRSKSLHHSHHNKGAATKISTTNTLCQGCCWQQYNLFIRSGYAESVSCPSESGIDDSWLTEILTWSLVCAPIETDQSIVWTATNWSAIIAAMDMCTLPAFLWNL